MYLTTDLILIFEENQQKLIPNDYKHSFLQKVFYFGALSCINLNVFHRNKLSYGNLFNILNTTEE